jgi:hypothetical protein
MVHVNIWGEGIQVDVSSPSGTKLVYYVPIFLDGMMIELSFGACIGYAAINGKLTPYLDEMISDILTL